VRPETEAGAVAGTQEFDPAVVGAGIFVTTTGRWRYDMSVIRARCLYAKEQQVGEVLAEALAVLGFAEDAVIFIGSG
jgi:hypothetical protein